MAFTVTMTIGVIISMLSPSSLVICSEDPNAEIFTFGPQHPIVIERESIDQTKLDSEKKIIQFVSPIRLIIENEKRRNEYRNDQENNDIPTDDGIGHDITETNAKKITDILFNKATRKPSKRNEEGIGSRNDYNSEVVEVPILSSPIFEVGEPFYNLRQKYIEDSIKIIPPFPELHQSSITDVRDHDFPKKNGTFVGDHSNQLSSSKNVQPTSNVSEKNKNSIISLLVRTDSGKLFYSRNDEQIFEPLPLARHKEFHTMPPFEELYVESHPNIGTNPERQSESVPTMEKKTIRNQVGPELYPSSIFERELRVPFF